MALAVIMLQGGMREVMQAQGSVWELKLMELGHDDRGRRVARRLRRTHPRSHQKIVISPDTDNAFIEKEMTMDLEVGSNLYRNTDGTIEIEGVPQIQSGAETFHERAC